MCVCVCVCVCVGAPSVGVSLNVCVQAAYSVVCLFLQQQTLTEKVYISSKSILAVATYTVLLCLLWFTKSVALKIQGQGFFLGPFRGAFCPP